jgi:hypothetical protein
MRARARSAAITAGPSSGSTTADGCPSTPPKRTSGLDAHRVELTTGRDLDLPGAEVRELNFVVYPHVEVDGALHEAVDTDFRFREPS